MTHTEKPEDDGPRILDTRAANLAVRDPAKLAHGEAAEPAAEGAHAEVEDPVTEPAAGRPATVHEHVLARTALHVIEPCMKRIARRFPRLVHESGLLTRGDLHAIGQEALLRAAQTFDARLSHNFECYARHMVRYRMLSALDGLLFEERVKRAAAAAEDSFGAFFVDETFDVSRHDEDEARRRFQAFAKGLFTSMFVGAVQEAEQCLDQAEASLRREFTRAVALVRKALACFVEADRQIIALLYRDGLTLTDASERLHISYKAARNRRDRVTRVLHELLIDHGIDFAPRPLVVPEEGMWLGAPAGPGNDSGTPGPR